MKKKKKNWANVPWTPFQLASVQEELYGRCKPPAQVFVNSRYQVAFWFNGTPDGEWGEWVHLSFKVHDRQPYHDWRDMQRIKNEIVGPDYDAVEIYPAESKLVDTSNQYHLFVFRTLRLPFGFQERLVSEGPYPNGAVQRTFADRPADCLSSDQVTQMAMDALKQKKEDDQ